MTALTGSVDENYGCVDEDRNAPNEDNDYVYTTGADLEDYYRVPDTSVSGTINYVRVYTRGRSVTANQHANGVFRSICSAHGTAGYGTDNAPINTSYNTFYDTWVSTPSGGSWTWDAVNNMQIGVNLKSIQVPTASLDYNLDTNGAGDDTEWNDINGAATHWEAVKSSEPFVYVRDNSKVIHDDLYNFEGSSDMGSSASGTIDYVVCHALLESGTAQSTRHAMFATKDYGAISVTTAFVPAIEQKTWYSAQYNSTTTDKGWTWDALDAAQFGLRADDNASPSVYDIIMHQMYIVVHYRSTFIPQVRCTQVYSIVNYQPAADTITLTTPSSLQVAHSRQVNRHTFPTGNYKVDDYGRAGKTLTISGMENSSATSLMQNMKDMIHYGAVVTVAGLPDSNLNTDYHIMDFSFSQEGGEDGIYSWNISMEEN